MFSLQDTPDIVTPEYEGSRTIVLIPNISAGAYLHSFYDGLQFFEERYLYFLVYLRQPKTRVVLILSEGLDPAYLDYVFGHVTSLLGVPRAALEERITYIWVPTLGEPSLTHSLVKQPDILNTIKEAIPQDVPTYIEFFRTTKEAVKVADALDLPWYGIPEDLLYINEKIGSKEIFAAADVPCARGYSAFSEEEIVERLHTLMKETKAEKFFIKANDAGGGVGIASIERKDISSDVTNTIAHVRLAGDEDVSQFFSSMRQEGCIVEEVLSADVVNSPSVQFEIFPDGTIKNNATHEQVITEGIFYAGVSFPAKAAYRQQVIDMGTRIAEEIADRGGLGIGAIDLLAIKDNADEHWQISAIEINARKGGTTHTYMWAMFLTGSVYNEVTGLLKNDQGAVYYRGTEEFLKREELKHISVESFLEAFRKSGLDFDHSKKTGAFIHMATCLPHFGKFGVTVIGRTPEEVEEKWHLLEEFVKEFE